MDEKNMQEILAKAEVLIEALPYIQRFNRKIIVVKYGGSAMVDEELKRHVIQDVTLLKLVGFKPIIYHGASTIFYNNDLTVETLYVWKCFDEHFGFLQKFLHIVIFH